MSCFLHHSVAQGRAVCSLENKSDCFYADDHLAANLENKLRLPWQLIKLTKSNSRNRVAVDMQKLKCVLSHIQRDIKENLSHLNPLCYTVWAPSASNIGVECTHLISIILCAWRPGLCPLLSALTVWCPNEPRAAHTAASDVPQRQVIEAVHFTKDTSSLFCCSSPLASFKPFVWTDHP